MGKRGPSRTPTRILELRGSWRAKTRAGEPAPRRARPRCPDWLSEDARKVFAVVVRRLWAMEVGTRTDEEAIARYADLLVQYRRVSAFVTQHGEAYVVRGKPRREGEEGPVVGIKPYPQAKRQETLAMLLLRLEKEFGLTPAARAHFAAQTPKPEAPVYDYFRAGKGAG